ncbi:sorting nexin 16 [Phyllostomus discolor]|uniref:Sorting nexin 16 n=1 Tax=Phyllostomus discolor TaxID=89673 RepID=A0A833ZQF1_9CHIR|nr:sorting nexin 16 [Phyllostomus discolor]
MATPYVPVPMPIGNSSSSFTTNRNQRSSSFGSISTNSNSSKGQLEESNMGNLKQTSVPDLMDGSPLVRTKFTNANSSIEYSTRPRESEEQNSETVNLEDRPSTPTILGYEVMEERAKFTAFCETLEETNYRFQKELFEKQKEVESLKKLLSEKQLHIEMLEKRIRADDKSCLSFSEPENSVLEVEVAEVAYHAEED